MSDSINSVFILDSKWNVYNLRVLNEILDELSVNFQKSIDEFYSDSYRHITYRPDYKPDDDELSEIENFNISSNIIDAIKNPASAQDFDVNEIQNIDIRCIFLGKILSKTQTIIIFKRFYKNFIITRERKNFVDLILGDRNTYRHFDNTILSIPSDADAVYDGSKLIFKSFKITNEMLGLSQYYREASDGNINHFITSNQNCMKFENYESKYITTKIRKLIAIIIDDEIMNKYSVQEILDCANKQGITIETVDCKGVKKIKVDLAQKDSTLVCFNFLAQNTFKTTFSQELQVTNSRRKL